MSANKLTRREALGFGIKSVAATALGGSLMTACTSFGIGGGGRKEFNVLKYGAVGDGTTFDSPAIQKAIDAAFAAGGGRVVIPGGRKYLTGTLVLRSKIDFHLADDAELLASNKEGDYAASDQTLSDPTHVAQAVILASGATDLKFSGTGNINGRYRDFMLNYDAKDEWWIFGPFRPKIFVLTECKGVEVRDMSFGDAPQWGLHMLGCEHVLVDNLKVRNELNVPNCDGIDPDHCRDVEINNCDLVCGDDAIVLKATRQSKDYGDCANIRVKDCVMKTQDSAIKIGTETAGKVHDVKFERCKISECNRGLTIQLRDEGSVYNIEYSDIEFTSRYFSAPWWGRGEAISLTAIPRGLNGQIGAIGTIHDISFKNIKCRAENSIRVNGSKESRISNVTFDNVAIELDRWTKYPGNVYDNRPSKFYPELENHGTAGFNIRRADNVTLKDCSVAWGKGIDESFTYAVEADDAPGLKIENFKGEAAHPQRDKAIVQS